jgi:copper chaperone CopZ
MSTIKKFGLPGLLLVGALMFALRAALAGPLEVKQTVYGMDCAPCAYGVQKSLEKLPGVESAKVSLNTGVVDIRLKPGNDVTLEKIQEVIKAAGFEPKGGEVVKQ